MRRAEDEVRISSNLEELPQAKGIPILFQGKNQSYDV